MKLKSKFGFRLALALLFSASVGTLVIAAPPEAAAQSIDDSAALDLFANSSYNYCDAKLVGAAFIQGGTPYTGKLAIGRKISYGQPNWIEGLLTDARNSGVSCEWIEVSHSYEDAQTLGDLWGVSTWEAKSKIAGYYTQGQSDIVDSALAQNQSAPSDTVFYNKYADSSYNYCDAKLVGSAFGGVSPYDGKLAIGQKLYNGAGNLVEGLLNDARQAGTQCEFRDVGHSYEDAQTLGNLWGVSTWDAKTKIAGYYTNGQSSIVESALEQENSAPDEGTLFNYYAQSNYNYCDAKLVGSAFYEGGSAYDGKLAIGQKLYHNVPDLVEGLLTDARQAGTQCEFGDVGHSYEDAVKLSQVWGVSTWDAKTKIAGYYTNGQSDIVRDVLATL